MSLVRRDKNQRRSDAVAELECESTKLDGSGVWKQIPKRSGKIGRRLWLDFRVPEVLPRRAGRVHNAPVFNGGRRISLGDLD